MDRHVGVASLELAKLAVVGPEVVAPVADAVGLVDGERAHAGLAQQVPEPVTGQALRGHENQFVPTSADAVADPPAVAWVEAAVEIGRRDASLDERVNLVLHKRDQGREDDGGLIGQEGGGLVAERLAPAGGQHHQGIASLEGGGHGLALQGPQRAEAPVFLQNAAQRGNLAVHNVGCGCCHGRE